MRCVKQLSVCAALIAAGFLALVTTPLASAQDATPAPATPCAAMSPEDNVMLVQNFIHVADAADAAAIDAALANNYTDNQDRFGLPVDNTTNADEANLAAMLEALYPGSTYTINQLAPIGDNQVVADITLMITAFQPDPNTPATTLPAPIAFNSIAIYTVECGEIVSARSVSDQLGLLMALGFQVVPPTMATPTP